ncbi:MAG: hypothetical protein CMQ20_10105 [Gammaproteobacteria bacterium]|nr:hypothetical protein [Gammaproteobacteria bacterium]
MSNTAMTKEKWVSLFQEIGLDEATMTQWHRAFETRHPEEHQSFLEWLSIPEEEISQIRGT